MKKPLAHEGSPRRRRQRGQPRSGRDMAASVRLAAGRIDHPERAARCARAGWMSPRSWSICRIGHLAAPNARQRSADALGVLAGRPIPAVGGFRETFSRTAASWGERPPIPGARRSGSAWGMREPDRHFAASPRHPGGQV